jgi:serine/threonine protein kinase
LTSPDITPEKVLRIIPQLADVRFLDKCGQKTVFTALIEGHRYAIKFMKPDIDCIDEENSDIFDSVTARAKREVETMKQCNSAHLVKIGPIELESAIIENEKLLYFSEEYIEGRNLIKYQSDVGNLAISELLRLARQVSMAICEIWNFSKIHRDIKPGNIMRREANANFVLLDMGLVFDLKGKSFSNSPVGTFLYCSPEQLDFINRRKKLDFRSDFFSLGIVLYEVSTGRHPFITSVANSEMEVLHNIVNMNPNPPINHRNDMPMHLNNMILRLLAKSPSLRYRSIEKFQQDLDGLEI